MATDNFGAFVEIDEAKLGREGLFLLGAREAIDRWITKFRVMSSMQQHPGVGQVLADVAEKMAEDRDEIAVALTKTAIKERAGVIHDLPGGKGE